MAHPGDTGIRQTEEETIDLKTAMRQAATYEQLIASWGQLVKRLDVSRSGEHGTAEYWLGLVYRCFSVPPYECDTGVKTLFEDDELLKKVRELGIPEKFLLQTVRIGALRGMLCRVERAPDRSVTLPYDGTVARHTLDEVEKDCLPEPDAEMRRLRAIISIVLTQPILDGYSWADKWLRSLEDQRRAAAREETARKEEETRRRKQEVIVAIEARMYEPNFHFDPADAELLRNDFKSKLRIWKAFFESRSGRRLDGFMRAHTDDRFTPGLFAEFKNAFEGDARVQEEWTGKGAASALPLEIIDPDSGWFSVLIINKQTTLGVFQESACSNMDNWFKL